MTQIGNKEIEKIKSDIERGDYDLEKCMNLRNSKLRVELARHGRHVDMLAERNEPRVLVALIEHGYAENYYDKWKTHENGDVRRALARRGYYPEVFIRDKNESVRHAAFNRHPEYDKIMDKTLTNEADIGGHIAKLDHYIMMQKLEEIVDRRRKNRKDKVDDKQN